MDAQSSHVVNAMNDEEDARSHWRPLSRPAGSYSPPSRVGRASVSHRRMEAWFAIYKARADVPVSEHMKSIVFSDGETVTYVQGERSWIAAAGFKGSRMFYRKALLSCGGRVWHNVAFEYPIEMKDRMDRFIALAAEGLRDSQTDCDDAVAEHKR